MADLTGQVTRLGITGQIWRPAGSFAGKQPGALVNPLLFIYFNPWQINASQDRFNSNLKR